MERNCSCCGDQTVRLQGGLDVCVWCDAVNLWPESKEKAK